jgi:hypothetical protein
MGKIKLWLGAAAFLCLVGIMLWYVLTPSGKAERQRTIQKNQIVEKATQLGNEAKKKAFCDYYTANAKLQDSPPAYKYCWENKL